MGPEESTVEKERRIDYSDPNLTLDANEDTWAWRRRIRSDPRAHLAYRCLVGTVGALVTVIGLIAVPAPGPGWLIVFIGLTILASEFEFAQRLLHFARRHVSGWNDWVMARPIWVRAVLGLTTVAFVWALVWAWLVWQGVPEFFPDWAEGLLRMAPGID
ncbi:MAG TPA: TIGR02611 family protein [Dermatophilaceae bacterium]|nr:TIGR02611 family protein [Dermatophilaceae bacterium]